MTRSESASKELSGWMVDVRFHRCRIGAELLCGNNGRLFGLLHDPLVDLLGAFLAKERKSPTQIAKIWNGIFIKAREAPIQEAGSQFALKFAIRPAFDVFKHYTAQQPIRSNALATAFARTRRAACQDPSAQSQ